MKHLTTEGTQVFLQCTSSNSQATYCTSCQKEHNYFS